MTMRAIISGQLTDLQYAILCGLWAVLIGRLLWRAMNGTLGGGLDRNDV
mgnify:CR=1 FL=1